MIKCNITFCSYYNETTIDDFSCDCGWSKFYTCSTHGYQGSSPTHTYTNEYYWCSDHKVRCSNANSHTYNYEYYSCSTHNWTGSTKSHTYCREHNKVTIHFPN